VSAVEPKRIAVIGGGITGVSTALFLQSDGHAVTIFEPDEFGTGTSSGNAGVISLGSCIPTAMPGIPARVPGMLLAPYGPLAIRWGYLPKLTPWLLSFLMNCTSIRARKNASAKAALLDRAHAAYDMLIHQADAENLVSRRGMLKVYESEASFARAKFEIEVLQHTGRRFDIVSGDEIRQLEPGLAPIFARGLFFDDNSGILNPGKLVARFAETFVAQGGKVVERHARIFSGNGPYRIHTDGGEEETDIIVIAAGSWSSRLARQFGTRILLDAERGYHVMLPHPETPLNRPVALTAHSVFLSPMDDGMRLTTGVELGGNESPPDYTRVRRMISRVAGSVNGFRAEEQSVWLGFRPSTPNGVPFIDELPGHPNVYIAAGGGHVGMTMAPISGRIISDLVAGRDPDIDLAPYRVNR
jgi:D-amino-acid dehydrogenase